MMRTVLVCLLSAALAWPQKPEEDVVFRTSSNLVLVTVFARGKQGQPLAGLTKEDFTLIENGKPQAISVFDFQKIDAQPPPPATTLAERPTEAAKPEPLAAGAERFRDRRLLVLYFDWSSMQPADQVRAKESAEQFIRTQMTTADLVSMISFASKLKVDVDFTADKDLLLEQIAKYPSGIASEFAEAADAEADTSEDAAFAADETEFNLFNTDRKLIALEDTARRLGALPEKKALVYFTSGGSRTGGDNESQLRATINAAVRGNVSFYPVDVKGLQAEPPGGGAASAGARGTGLFSGQTQTRQRDRAMQQQDTMTALASDTGGKALLDDNNLVTGIVQAQQDLQSYYVLGYYSSDDRRDGRFRRVEVKLTPAAIARTGGAAKLDSRGGYFAEKEFKTFNRFDKERQLEDALLLGDPVTDLRLALEVNWFRFAKDRYFVPVAVKIPGSAIPLAKKGTAETTGFDFIGQVRNARGGVVATVRDGIKIQLREEKAGKLGSSSLLYDTGFTLPPGEYKIRMLVRENQSGRMGTFETSFTIPDLNAAPAAHARVSSVVWSSQLVPIAEAVGAANRKLVKKQNEHPLVMGNGRQKLMPSVTRVFRPGQKLAAYAELYDPAQTEGAAAVSAVVGLYRDRQLVAQSQPVRVSQLAAGRAAAPLLVELPLQANLAAGEYAAQLTVIDEAGRRFAASRTPVVVTAR
ncbi:MAG: VWA domain-containing protein [Bryobacterales bacterium]|nr:VWA domain-containing protein [Bryobacterales bacterium]